MWWFSSSGLIELNITARDAASASHAGQCDADVQALARKPSVRKQLDKINELTLANELAEYGAWERDELRDHEQNLQRLLWIACGDIKEGNN